MNPILFKLPVIGIPIYAYGAMLATGFLTALLFAQWRAKKEGVGADLITDIGLIAVIGGIVGARALFVFQNWGEFKERLFSVFAVWEGGLVFYGGFIVATIAIVFFLRYKKQNVLKTADLLAPAIPLAGAFTRIGCFLNGCCWGAPGDVPWAVRFPPGSPAFKQHVARNLIPDDATCSLPVHPTQLYSSLDFLVIFVLLLVVTKYRKVYGQPFFALLFFYSIGRFTIEFFRGDNPAWWPAVSDTLTISQYVSIMLFTASIAAFVALKRFGTKVNKR